MKGATIAPGLKLLGNGRLSNLGKTVFRRLGKGLDQLPESGFGHEFFCFGIDLDHFP